MALLERVAKLGSGAYGARHARVRPSIMQCVLAVRETVAQGLSNSLPLSLPWPLYTSLFQKRGRAASTLNTHRQASLMVSRYTTLVPPLRSCIGIGPAREAGLSTGATL